MTPTPKVVPKISEPSPSRNVNIDDKFERLKSLSPCHVFSKDDLNVFIRCEIVDVIVKYTYRPPGPRGPISFTFHPLSSI